VNLRWGNWGTSFVLLSLKRRRNPRISPAALVPIADTTLSRQRQALGEGNDSQAGKGGAEVSQPQFPSRNH